MENRFPEPESQSSLRDLFSSGGNPQLKLRAIVGRLSEAKRAARRVGARGRTEIEWFWRVRKRPSSLRYDATGR
jgi:hypothetical protein